MKGQVFVVWICNDFYSHDVYDILLEYRFVMIFHDFYIHDVYYHILFYLLLEYKPHPLGVVRTSLDLDSVDPKIFPWDG